MHFDCVGIYPELHHTTIRNTRKSGPCSHAIRNTYPYVYLSKSTEQLNDKFYIERKIPDYFCMLGCSTFISNVVIHTNPYYNKNYDMNLCI